MAAEAKVIELKPGMGIATVSRRRPFAWWHRGKKRIRIFPGLFTARSAKFLSAYYKAVAARRNAIGVIGNTIVLALLQIWLPFRTCEVALRYGLGVKWIWRAYNIARKRIVDPNEIAVFRIQAARDYDHYLRRFENWHVNKAVNPSGMAPDSLLNNKIEFYARCVEKDLPHPQVFATLVDGDVRVHALPPDGQFAVKLAGAIGGSGFRLMQCAAPDIETVDQFRHFLARELDPRDLWVAQEKLAVDPALAAISLSALPTARVTTMLNEKGEPEIVTSVLRLAGSAGAIVDNVKAGGLIAPIDLQTGQLGLACSGSSISDYETHPVTGQPITGQLVPRWDEIRAMALDAHSCAFADYTMIGWDIAPTDKGPMIIEGNANVGIVAAQLAPRAGFGHMRFGQLLEFHLARAFG